MCFDHWSEVIGEARTRLHRQLEVSGAATAPGFIIGFINGHFDPRTEKFRLEYRGIAAGDKLKSLRQPQPVVPHNRPHRGLRITVHEITDLPMQISRMLPNAVRERVPSVIDGGVRVKRMRQPYDTTYLIWLAGHRLADLAAIDGAFYWNGGLQMRECYDEDVLEGPHSAVPTRFAPVLKAQRVPRSSSVRDKPVRKRPSKPRDVYQNQSNRRRRRRVAAIFPNAQQSLNVSIRRRPRGSAVDLDIDDVDTGLRFGVRTGVPSAVTELGAVNLGQEEATPFAVGRQAGSALAGELVGERRLLPMLVAEDVRAKLAIEALVIAGDLLLAVDGVAEQRVDGAGHDRRSLRYLGDRCWC